MAADQDYLAELLAQAEDGHEYQWLDEYHGNPNELLKIKHHCGFTFNMTPNQFKAGKRCYIHQHCGYQGGLM
jgi:hypothetical protein